ncbi:MAG: DUF177 domain-containing protein [Chloroflexi bacterium]|nr:DUF177 domain-containing protein [Chloroflexota bacterium]
MLYNVAQLIKESIGATRHYNLDGQLAELDENNPSPVRFQGKVVLMRSALGVLATVDAQFEANQVCRRCLEPTRRMFKLHFDEEYLPTIDIETGLKIKLDKDADPVLLIDEHHIIDISELLRQYALVEVAGGSLCQSGCKGLCPECGQNLNQGTCSCKSTFTDPRLSVLTQLLAHKE